MTTHKGKEGAVSVGGEDVGELRSFEVTVTANEVDTSIMGSDWTGTDSTQNSWKGSMVMFWDPDDTAQTAIVVGSKVALVLYPQGDTTGLVQQSGTALITSVGRANMHDGIIERSVEFTGDGPLTESVVA